MTTYVALLRGINVGGRNSLPMKELSALFAELGCRDTKTYIQSGNAVFRSSERSEKLARAISNEINRRHGFKPHLLLLDRTQFEQAITNNPFKNEPPDSRTLHFGFLDTIPEAPDLEGITALKSPTEQFALVDHVFYLLAPDGIGRSKLAARSEKLLGCPMTDRNGRTVSKLMSMLVAAS